MTFLIFRAFRHRKYMCLQHQILEYLKKSQTLSGASRVFCGLRSRRTPMEPADLCHALRAHYPGSHRLLHFYPQPFRDLHSIPTVLSSISLPLQLLPLHSADNATVYVTLRGASRLEERRKALQLQLVPGFRLCGDAKLCYGTARAIAADGGSGIRTPAGLCIASLATGPPLQGRKGSRA